MQKQPIIILVAVLLAGMVLICFHSSAPKSFEEIIPEKAKPIQYCDIQWESQISGDHEPEISDQELAEILNLLDQFQYKREGNSKSIQNCVVRLFLGPVDGERVELMLTSDLKVLVNDLHVSDKCVIYEMLPAAEIESGEQFVNELLRILK